MVVITLEKTKELLGITDTSQDAAISAKIPYIDAKVKQVTKNNWDYKFVGSPESGSNKLYVYPYLPDNYNGGNYTGINNPNLKTNIYDSLEIGQLITGEGIQADTYIQNIVKEGVTSTNAGFVADYVYIELSANATSTEESTELTAGINIAYQDVIAKGIQYLINGTSTNLPSSGVASKSYGPVSVSFSNKSQKIDGKSGMPAWFVQGLPRYTSGGC